MPDKFTFYGDLLGIGAAYKFGPKVAYEKLNTFYNTAFEHLAPLCENQTPKIHVQMFSDSLVAWGAGVNQILQPLLHLYNSLLNKSLLLRGALVHGALLKEPRIEAANFRKFLPRNDTLARAVGLEKTVRGARFLIETALATEQLKNQPEWVTVEGYVDHLIPTVPIDSVLRRICPAPSGASHELLYPWQPPTPDAQVTPSVQVVRDRLSECAEFYDEPVADHLRETLKLLKRAEARREQTERRFRQREVT